MTPREPVDCVWLFIQDSLKSAVARPQQDLDVVATSGQLLAVRTPGETVDDTFMALQYAYGRAVGIP